MVIVEFRSRLRRGVDEAAYHALEAELRALVATHPGFISIESFDAADGTAVSIEHFEDMTSVLAWRERHEHVEAQRRGREEFYEWYSVRTCEVVRSFEFERAESTS